ncbi:restriction endonuclease subunit S [Acidithiobacillus sp. AMEEHan]|uniref:restriction endonuclease subunit S n=1 Tax=Acidithiobacillus sp. AMEEHan TaxID=2994951 RepID=UPI0027E402A8|nr:restriction endonuclease subunit S [Acidithiobacillus sp. AMEEHan]
MSWRDCNLGDLLEIKHGYAFLGEYFADVGTHIVLTPGNFFDEGGFKQKGDKEKWYRGPIPSGYVLNEGDLIVAMTEQAEGLLGSSAIIPRSGIYLHNQRLGLVQLRDAGQTDTRFVYYIFNWKHVRQQIRASASGTKIRHTAPSRIASVKVRVPSVAIQRRIAGILSAYDELIENSQRRIRILESMARALYREWFVHFRFPGHESIRRVPSSLGEIPQGWEVKRVADSFEISGGGTPSRKEERYWDGGAIQWFSPSDLTSAGTMFMDDSSDHITALGLVESSARLFPAMSVMLTSRATIGAIAINTREACTNQGFITCLPNDRVPLYFLFHWVTESVPTFQRLASGATFKEISRGVFKTIEFLQPPAQLTEGFEAVVAPMAGQILALQRQIQNLRRTRDLLLPRLLSGQIDVEALDHA